MEFAAMNADLDKLRWQRSQSYPRKQYFVNLIILALYCNQMISDCNDSLHSLSVYEDSLKKQDWQSLKWKFQEELQCIQLSLNTLVHYKWLDNWDIDIKEALITYFNELQWWCTQCYLHKKQRPYLEAIRENLHTLITHQATTKHSLTHQISQYYIIHKDNLLLQKQLPYLSNLINKMHHITAINLKIGLSENTYFLSEINHRIQWITIQFITAIHHFQSFLSSTHLVNANWLIQLEDVKKSFTKGSNGATPLASPYPTIASSLPHALC